LRFTAHSYTNKKHNYQHGRKHIKSTMDELLVFIFMTANGDTKYTKCTKPRLGCKSWYWQELKL